MTHDLFSDAGETACGGPAGSVPPVRSRRAAVRSVRRPGSPPSGPPAVRVAAAGRLPRPIGLGGGGGEKNSRFYTKTTSSSFLSTCEKKMSERSDKTRFYIFKKNILSMARLYFLPFVGRNLHRKGTQCRVGGKGGRGMARPIRKQVFLPVPENRVFCS